MLNKTLESAGCPEYVEELPTRYFVDAFQLLGETPHLRGEMIKSVQMWLDENPKICGNKDPKIIVNFLRGCKFNLHNTKKKIKNYYRMRAERIEWFQNRDPRLPEIDELLKLGCFLALPDKDSENRLVVVIRTAAHDPKIHSQNNVFKVCKMLLELALHLDETVSIYGVVAIFDMKDVSLGHALQLNPSLIRRSVQSWENFSSRPQRLEFVNAPMHVNLILNIFRAFMTTKMKKRVIITKGGQPNVLVQLPTDLGGDGPSYEQLTKYWYDKANEHRDWFSAMERFKSFV